MDVVGPETRCQRIDYMPGKAQGPPRDSSWVLVSMVSFSSDLQWEKATSYQGMPIHKLGERQRCIIQMPQLALKTKQKLRLWWIRSPTVYVYSIIYAILHQPNFMVYSRQNKMIWTTRRPTEVAIKQACHGGKGRTGKASELETCLHILIISLILWKL